MADSNEVLIRLLAAVLFGAAIGFERQWHQHKAGLQTNALVSLGSALFVSVNMLTPGDASPTRIASMVVSGIGFLCAGVIMRQGLSVMGLNTAATMWCAAGVGVLAGMSHVWQAGLATVIIILANSILRTISRYLDERQMATSAAVVHYLVTANCPDAKLTAVRAVLASQCTAGWLELRSLHHERSGPGETVVRADLMSRGNSDQRLEQIIAELGSKLGIAEAGWEVIPQEDSSPATLVMSSDARR